MYPVAEGLLWPEPNSTQVTPRHHPVGGRGLRFSQRGCQAWSTGDGCYIGGKAFGEANEKSFQAICRSSASPRIWGTLRNRGGGGLKAGPDNVWNRCGSMSNRVPLRYRSSMSSRFPLTNTEEPLSVLGVLDAAFPLSPRRPLLESSSMRLKPGSLRLILEFDTGSTVDPRKLENSLRIRGFAKSSAAQRIAVFSSIALCAVSRLVLTCRQRRGRRQDLRPDVRLNERPSDVVLV